jgi:hypothetical protein
MCVQFFTIITPAVAGSPPFILTQESVTMNLIKRWFEQIAGVSQGERERWALAQAVFGAQRIDTSALQKPACWRRKSPACRVQR